MLKKLFHKIQGDRKYFAIVFFIFVLILISAFHTSRIVESVKNNWNEELANKIEKIELSVHEQFEEKMLSLLNTTDQIKSDLRNIFTTGDEAYREIIRILNRKKFEDYSIGVFAPNGRMIAWNNPVIITQENLFPLNSPLGEIYFLETDLITYLSQTDTVLIDNDNFYLTISNPIEKKFSLQNKYFNPVSFIQELSEKNRIDFEITYNPFSPKTRDGKKVSFDLLNNAGNKIGLVTFYKPVLMLELNNIKEVSSKIQASLVFVLIIFTALGMRPDYLHIKSRLVKISFLILFLSIARTVLFLLEFPSSLISGSLSDPSNFSSIFAWGIVKSPIEFLTTNIFLLIVAIQIYRNSRNYFFSETPVRFKKLVRILSLPLLIIFLLLIRGISASAKSVIFDSTIRYFKEPDIIPNLSALLMNFNMLILTVAVFLSMLGILFVIFKGWRLNNSKLADLKIIFFAIGLLVSSVLFYFIQKDPLISLFLTIVFVTIILLIFYQIRFRNPHSIFNYVYITFAASVISITLLNFFNVKLERESLKTTAYEINRANESLLHFLLDEIFRSASVNEEIGSSFNRRFINYDAIAFKLWSSSPIQRESLNSFVGLFDKNRNLAGSFNVGLSKDLKPFNYLKPLKTGEPVIQEVFLEKNSDSKVFMGLVSFYERQILQGYLALAVSFDLSSISALNFPEFLESSTSILNRVIDIRNLKIFEFTNNELTQVYGDRYPSREQIKEIISTKLSDFNDGWIRLNFEGENFITFILKTTRDDQEKITAVLVGEKQFTWNLFNFFKIFIIHTFFILILIIILFLARLKKINYTFKSKLLIAFLLVSIIPVISLALYNRQAVSSKGEEAIISELRQRSQYVENHILYQRNNNPKRELNQIFENAAKELGIAFSIYKLTDEIYNSNAIYRKVGLFDGKLNSQAHYFINYLRYKEYLTGERIENYNYDALYRSIDINGQEYILSVNDAFNKIRVSFSTVEIDVVIFGIYSFAVLIIILLSTLFANQLAYPIRRLTKAAESVGQGDLNVKIDHNEKGELKDLINGFNKMTSELQKNQAELAELEREAAWKEMAKQVAHEIKNPLTPMKLALQQLNIAYMDKNKDFESLFGKVVKTVLNQIENLSHIAGEFSRFAKMPSLKLEIIDLVTVITDTINLYQDEKIKIEFKSEIDSAIIEADKSHLRRIFINLIRNSIQANANAILIELLRNEKVYTITVQDNGSGISPEDQMKIFDESFTTKKQGMGLGLAITRKFIESINGSIKLKFSKPGDTVFEILIPVNESGTESDEK